MLSRWPIRRKLLVGLSMLLAIVGTLSYSGFHGVYSYRSMVKELSARVAELPLAADLSHCVSDLRVALRDLRNTKEPTSQIGRHFARHEFKIALETTRESLATYAEELRSGESDEDGEGKIGDRAREWRTVRQIESTLDRVEKANRDADWYSDSVRFQELSSKLDQLQRLVGELPRHLSSNIRSRRAEVRSQYRTLIGLVWFTSVSALVLFGLFIYFCYRWVFRPLRLLIKGSRKVASGCFNFRILLNTNDEMAELARALNDMTSRFKTIRDDLDHQVAVRTKQAIRSEKLASVGFLAAGVAHEINNPLASVAICAESLEGRMDEVLPEGEDRDLVQHYLRIIQNEAFRCKGITEKLRDFSRMGQQDREPTDVRELVQEMIDLLTHHDNYRDKTIELVAGGPLVIPVNPQEIKQVVLNLLVNALESLDPGGIVRVEMARTTDSAVLTFTDNGCGMTEEVLEHLFEPFFTRRRDGQGTGLGLSITHRIIEDHHGQIEAASDGPGKGSRFRVTLPLSGTNWKEPNHRYQAA